MIDFIMSCLGYVRTERAKDWASEAFEQAVIRTQVHYLERDRSLLNLADREAAAARAARAQRDTLQGLYDKANRRLEKAGLISVTTFV